MSGVPAASSFGAFDGLRGYFADDVVEGFFGGVADFGAEKDVAGLEGGFERGFAVDEFGDLAGEGFVGFAGAGVGGVGGFERLDFFAGEEGELAEVFADFRVLSVHRRNW